MPVSDQHPLYTANISRRKTVRDCIAGGDVVKAATIKYLPKPNPSDDSKENTDRYNAYIMRALFVNFTGHTKTGFMGMIGRKKSVIELNSTIDYLMENADGAGLGLAQLAQNNIDELLEVGQHGLLADFPTSAGGTMAQTMDLQAVIKQYPAESIINWREQVINSVTTLVMVVLAEQVEVIKEDGCASEWVTYHRVLFLQDNIYKQNLYDENDDLIAIEGEPDIIPRNFNGSTLDYIPFEFSGAENNDTTPDKPPLLDIAEINVGHYRNSADFEESCFLVGQPTLTMTGLTRAWVDDVLKDGVKMGSRTGLALPVGADAKLLQASPNQMPDRGMELKENQLIKVGAKMITDSGGVETAEAAKIRFAGQSSKLSIIVSNTEKSLLRVLGWIGEFMGTQDENIIEINREFYEATVNPQLLVANMQLMDRGVIGKSDVRLGMRKAGLIDADRTDEEIDQEVGNIDPLESSAVII